MSSRDINNQATTTTDKNGITISSLSTYFFKEDNGKQLYCRANNTQDNSVMSEVKTLNVMCKFTTKLVERINVMLFLHTSIG